jgi:hypothetical protein
MTTQSATVLYRAVLFLAVLGAAAPAALAGPGEGGATAPVLRAHAPPAGAAGKPTKTEPSHEQRQTPAAPGGCPFRDSKLELIV